MDGVDPVLQGVAAEAADALDHCFCHGAVVHGDDGRAAQHGFYCHAAERLGEDGGRQQGAGVAEKVAAGGAADRASVFDVGVSPRGWIALTVEHDWPRAVISDGLNGVDALEGSDASQEG